MHWPVGNLIFKLNKRDCRAHRILNYNAQDRGRIEPPDLSIQTRPLEVLGYLAGLIYYTVNKLVTIRYVID